MDSSTLRALQAPLKEQYRADPTTALAPIGATGRFSDDGVTCTVAGFAGSVRAGLHRATGGDGTDACSADMLLEALLACAGVTLRSVATSMGVDLGQVSLRAEGTFDARGTLGVDRAAPVGVQDVVVTIEVGGPGGSALDEQQLDRLARTTERYCVVGQSLKTPPRIVVRRRC
jgi:uncharacterized OsmC-like protein